MVRQLLRIRVRRAGEQGSRSVAVQRRHLLLHRRRNLQRKVLRVRVSRSEEEEEEERRRKRRRTRHRLSASDQLLPRLRLHHQRPLQRQGVPLRRSALAEGHRRLRLRPEGVVNLRSRLGRALVHMRFPLQHPQRIQQLQHRRRRSALAMEDLRHLPLHRGGALSRSEQVLVHLRFPLQHLQRIQQLRLQLRRSASAEGRLLTLDQPPAAVSETPQVGVSGAPPYLQLLPTRLLRFPSVRAQVVRDSGEEEELHSRRPLRSSGSLHSSSSSLRGEASVSAEATTRAQTRRPCLLPLEELRVLVPFQGRQVSGVG